MRLAFLSVGLCSISTERQNVYISNCALWCSRPSIIWHQNISRTAASRCPIRHVVPVSARHLAVCWTFCEHVLSSANVLSLLLDLRHGMHYPSTYTVSGKKRVYGLLCITVTNLSIFSQFLAKITVIVHFTKNI